MFMKRALVAVVFGAMLGLVGCFGEVEEPNPAASAPGVGSAQEELKSCPLGEHTCTSCNGETTYCGRICPDCATQIESLTKCPAGTHTCASCNGETTYCGRICPDCAVQ
jgi:hypothetical protein